jgi:hypothetical protein
MDRDLELAAAQVRELLSGFNGASCFPILKRDFSLPFLFLRVTVHGQEVALVSVVPDAGIRGMKISQVTSLIPFGSFVATNWIRPGHNNKNVKSCVAEGVEAWSRHLSEKAEQLKKFNKDRL